MKLIASDGAQYLLNQPEVTIGRDPSNGIVIADPRVSSHHATVQREGDVYVLRDLGSGGTFVNDSPLLGPYRLQPGDVISLGGYTLTFQADAYQPFQSMPGALPGAGTFPPRPTVLDSTPPPYSSAGQPMTMDPSMGYQSQAGYAPPRAYTGPVSYAAIATKDRSLALILEIVGGLFGFIGIGWIYAGQMGMGLAFLIGNWMFICFQAVLAAVTAGFSLCVTLPIEIAVVAVSAVMLNNHTKQHPELFRA
jgi:hypothetical protein